MLPGIFNYSMKKVHPPLENDPLNKGRGEKNYPFPQKKDPPTKINPPMWVVGMGETPPPQSKNPPPPD